MRFLEGTHLSQTGFNISGKWQSFLEKREERTYFGEVRDNCTSPHISWDRLTKTECSTSYLIFFYMSQFETESFHLKSINLFSPMDKYMGLNRLKNPDSINCYKLHVRKPAIVLSPCVFPISKNGGS